MSLLSLTKLKYLCVNHGDQRVFQFKIFKNDLVSALYKLYYYYVMILTSEIAPDTKRINLNIPVNINYSKIK